MLTLFLKLILAHLLGDFVLQPKSWVVKRSTNIFYLLLHIWVHTILLGWAFWPNWDIQWSSIAFIASAHLAIDSAKIWFEKEFRSSPIVLFVIDQLLHISVLLSVVFFIYGMPEGIWGLLTSNQAILYIIALLLTVAVSPIFLRIFFLRWNKEEIIRSKGQQSLLDAGMLIGILERIIIVLFIQLGFLSGIGFLLAAKSIFRFGDLSNAKDTKFTEYVLLGTLLSFTVAIGIGYALRIALRYAI